MDDAKLRAIIERVLSEQIKTGAPSATGNSQTRVTENGMVVIPDISKHSGEAALNVPNPRDPELLKILQKSTPARIGVFRAGTRYKTDTLLKFKSDHAVSMDAVFSEVNQEFLDRNNLATVSTMCADKDEYLTRPDLGRKLAPEAVAMLREIIPTPPQVLVYAADGLSSTAIEENIENILPAILSGLKLYNITVGKPFFLKYGRVPAMDQISEVTGADVVCTLIGERPGLVTAGSMSAYMAYKPTVGMPEARRTVISNIHKDGLSPVEAGAHIAELLHKILQAKASGLDLKL